MNISPSTQPAAAETPPRGLHSFFLDGPAGRLEALLNEGHPDAPFATVLCHPHPKGGGTMHNKVVYHAAKVLSALGWPVLRFNFRGTGLSEGQHHGRDEFNDVTAALVWMTHKFQKPIVAAGFSFGSVMGLKACSSYPDIRGFAALGLPTETPHHNYTYPFLADCLFPKLFLSGDHDQYAPLGSLRAAISTAAKPWQFELIPNADHFFAGRLDAMQAALHQWLTQTFQTDPKSAANLITPENSDR